MGRETSRPAALADDRGKVALERVDELTARAKRRDFAGPASAEPEGEIWLHVMIDRTRSKALGKQVSSHKICLAWVSATGAMRQKVSENGGAILS